MNDRGAVLVTGATGFLGSHLVHRLLAEGRPVHVYVRPEGSRARLDGVRARLTVHTGDLLDAESLGAACRAGAVTAVLHCAGDTTARRFTGDWTAVSRAMKVNLRGTLAVLEGAARADTVRTVVRLGGLEEYGTAPTPWDESQREEPSSPYSASQVAATHACQAMQPHLPFAVITLRPSLVYGPGQSSDFLIPALITALLRGGRFAMTAGEQGRDLLYVDDFVEAMLLAAGRSDLRGGLFNISSGREWPVVDVARRIAALIGAMDALDIGALAPRAGDLVHLVGRNDRAAELLAWQPRVSLEDGLRRTIAWHREQLGPRRSP
jgi:nucleoside-diphosphate-sugar epimerase